MAAIPKVCSSSRQVVSPPVDGSPRVADDVAAILVAAGSGRRFGGAKQYETLGDRRVLDWSIDAARSVCGSVVLVVAADRVDDHEPGVDVVVAGGDTRSASVRAGLAAVPTDTEIVVVHDAARPFATAGLFAAVVDAVRAGADAAVPGVPVVDTLRRVSGTGGPIARDEVVAVQTPQAFRARRLVEVHAAGDEATDDASLVDAHGGRVVVVPGAVRNRKITDPDDLVIARALAGSIESERSGATTTDPGEER